MEQPSEYDKFYEDFFEEIEILSSGEIEVPDSPGLSQDNVHKLTEDLLNPLPPDSDS